MALSKSRLGLRITHWLVGFFFHIIFSLTSLSVAIKDWDKDCEDDNDLQITGSGWLITSEAILIFYAVMLIPPFILWEAHPRRKMSHSIALNIYTLIMILFFSFFLVGWDIIGIFLLFEEIEECRGSGLWIMSVISLVRSWIHFMYPMSVVVLREIEGHWNKEEE